MLFQPSHISIPHRGSKIAFITQCAAENPSVFARKKPLNIYPEKIGCANSDIGEGRRRPETTGILKYVLWFVHSDSSLFTTETARDTVKFFVHNDFGNNLYNATQFLCASAILFPILFLCYVCMCSWLSSSFYNGTTEKYLKFIRKRPFVDRSDI